MKFSLHPKPPARERVVLAMAAAAVAAAQFIVVAAVFNDASREPILRDTPHNRLAVARCDAKATREARDRCVRLLVAAAKASDAGAARLAAAETARHAE